MKKRRIIQLVTTAPSAGHGYRSFPPRIYALCSDGTVWALVVGEGEMSWEEVPTIPPIGKESP